LAPKVAPHQAALSLLMVDRFDDPAKGSHTNFLSPFRLFNLLDFWLIGWLIGRQVLNQKILCP
jgi:hypothetical protein